MNISCKPTSNPMTHTALIGHCDQMSMLNMMGRFRRTARRTSRRMAKRMAPVQAVPPAAAPEAGPAPPPTEAPQTKPYVQELEELSALRDKGILSEEEFQAKKKQILNL